MQEFKHCYIIYTMQSLKGILTADKDIRKATKPVGLHSYKYSRGRVLIIADSREWRGAAVMAAYAANNAIAALRTVSGFVTVAAPKGLFQALSDLSPVFVLKELTGNESDYVKTIEGIRHDAIVMGPGIQKLQMALLERLVRAEERAGKPIIIDAGVIGLVSKKKSIITRNMILTPHDGEFKTLTGIELEGRDTADRIGAARNFSNKHGCTLVLKGHETIITDGTRLKVNIAKSPALATMGTGDVLAGIIASYAAQHNDLFESAVAGVRAHSLAGDILSKEKGVHILATDIIGALPRVLKKFDRISR